MKKTALLLVVMLVVSIFALSSCELLGKIPGLGDLINKPCEEHVDADGDYLCDNCGAELEKEDTPPPCEHKDENKDHNCDLCEEKLSEHAAGEGSHNCSVCGTKLSDCAAGEGSHNCSVCGTKLSDCAAAEGSHNCSICGTKLSDCASAEGSHNCSVCGTKLSDCTDADSNYACDVCGGDVIPDTHERVSYSLNISDLEAGTLDADSINSRFNIVAGSEIRNRTKTFEGVEYNKSVKIGNSATKIKVDVPGAGKLYFLVQNGSSGATRQFITVTAPDGTVQDIEFAGTDEGSPIVKIELDVTEGEWIISRGKNGGTQDIFYIDLSCIVEKSEESGFELVSEGTVDYLCGQKLDLSGIRLNSTYANGKTEALALENVTVDDSLVNLSQSGTYALTIKYKDYDPISININVYLPVRVELDFDGTVKGAQTAAGNGTYVNQSFKEVYAVGEELDITGLYVSIIGSLGEGNPKIFANISDYAYSYNDLAVGANTITVKYVFGTEEISATTTVYVVDTAPSIVEDAYQVKVDADYEGTIGAVVDGYNMFTTVQQALDFLATSEAGKRKIMIIEEGLYTEKLEITIPNLHIKGVGADKVTIEWDSIYGIKDAGGYSQITDSTQTVAIRDSAYGVTIEGVTISNYWNSQERMDAAGLGIERGLALLVQADRFIMRDSRLLGIQDTLELFTGRQYFENVFISGYTDFIFGTNNTTLFKNCTIHVIDTVKDDQGTAGYLTAFKGSNKGASDAITYGAIFYQCKFTADEGVMEGKTAIGRTWGAYAAVAVIESELGGHISLDGYVSTENKNKRYISMNGVHPTDETVQFVEYGNTGAGALTEAVAGMKMLTAEEAALYIDIATIFGKNNRGVSWLDAWDPAVTEIILDDRTYYNFDQSTSAGTSHTFDTTTTIASGTTLEWEGLLISAENGKVAWNANANALNMKAGAFIKFTVPAGTEVTVVTYPNYNYFTLNGVATASANMLAQYYAEETEVTLLSTGDLYIYQIIINPGEEAPEAPTLSEIKVSGMNVDYLVGEEFSLEGVSVNLHYSDNSVRPATDYTVDTSAVDINTAGEYVVVFTCGDLTANVTVYFVGDYTISESTTIDLSATGAKIEKATGTYKNLTIDATNGKFADNNGGWTQVNAGTIISFAVSGESEVSVTAYTSADNFTIEVADGVCTITCTANDYLKAIAVKITRVFTETTTVDLSATGANIQGSTGEYEGLSIDATNGKFADNNGGWTQVNAGTIITLNVADGASVSVTAYSSADNFTVAIADGVCTITCTGNDYLKAITVKYPHVYKETTTVDLSATGTAIQGITGTYEGLEIDATNGKFADNNGGWVQVNAGTVISLNVLEGAEVSVAAYSSADNFTVAIADGICTITCVGNDYLKSITVSYPIVYNEATTIDLSATGANIQGGKGTYEGLDVDATNGKFADNNGGWVQVNAGTIIKLNVAEGAEVSVSAYSSADNFTIAIADGVCTITCNANDYLKAISINYPIVYDEAATIDLSATNGVHIEGSTGVYEGLSVDATAGKFKDNGGGWVQVNAGTVITLKVADGASVSVSAYSSADNYTIAIADGVCTITCTGNDYLKAITVAY